MKIWVPIVVGLGLVSLLLYLSGIKGLVILIGVLMLVFMVLLYIAQNHILYMPGTKPLTEWWKVSQNPPPKTPEGADTQVNVVLNQPICTSKHQMGQQSEDGTQKQNQKIVNELFCFFMKVQEVFYIAIVDIGNKLDYVKILFIDDSDVVMVAYRGYSDSQGQSTEEGLMRDSYAIMEYAISYSKQHNNLPIYVLGRYLGGAVAINLATQQLQKNEITGLILQNTFTSNLDYSPMLKNFKFLLRNYWPSIDRIHLIKIPILFIKSMQDTTFPHEQMNRLQNAATSSRVMQYRSRAHNYSWELYQKVLQNKLIEFFIRVQE